MNIAERVAGFLRERRGQPYCDDCLFRELRLSRRQQANRVTMALGVTSEFQRAPGPCSGCAEEKKVTSAI